jgi:hypothetical protein
MDNIQDAKNIMGEDSVSNLKHYSILIKQIGPMMKLKDNIITVSYKEQSALRELRECQGKVGFMNNELRIDPTRKFTGIRHRR